MDASTSSLWRLAFVDPRTDASAEEQTAFRLSLLALRDLVAPIVARIANDMPGYTVHDVTHLDALWETASLVATEATDLNPAEAFVLGAAFLLHDAGMTIAAYPGGIDQIRETDQWRDTMALYGYPEGVPAPPSDVVEAVTTETVRQLHADRASEMATQKWSAANGTGDAFYIIENVELRKFYGPTIGSIASSHWWPIDKVEQELDRSLGKLPPFTNCKVDVLKLACLLRVADAIHLDRRRAPRFLRALEGPSGVSESHWVAQEKLAFPYVEYEEVIFTSGEPFSRDEADGWWLAYDAMMLADQELSRVHRLLVARRGVGLRARGVKGAGDPYELAQVLPVSGWLPVETKVRVSEVPKVVETLGGEKLYGSDPLASIRELVQNAMDAVQARRRLQGRSQDWGSVTVGLREDEGVWLVVEDNGIGMSSATITDTLLDFGASLWRSAKVSAKYPGLAASGMDAIGRFGIGFYSVFMLGDCVRVYTRRYDGNAQDGLKLEFERGLDARPILESVGASECPLDGGTRVEVRLVNDPRTTRGINFLTKSQKRGSGVAALDMIRPSTFGSLSGCIRYICPASKYSIETVEFGRRELAIAANDWETISAEALAERVSSRPLSKTELYAAGLMSDIVVDGRLVGRAAVSPEGVFYHNLGVVTGAGLRIHAVSDIIGVLEGAVDNVARSKASIAVPANALSAWADDQASRIAKSKLPDDLRAAMAEVVLQYGGHVGKMPLVKWRGRWWRVGVELERAIRGVSNALIVIVGDVIFDAETDGITKGEFDSYFKVDDEVFVIPSRNIISFNTSRVKNLLEGIIERAWGGSEFVEGLVKVGSANRYDIERDIGWYERLR